MDQTSTTDRPAINRRVLRAGEELSGVFACTGKQVLRSGVTGRPYLVVDLRDHSGLVPARAFRDPEEMAEGFEPGELVEASGTVRDFRGELQLHLAAIGRVPGDPTALLPHSYRDIDELDGFLEQLGREIADPGLARLLDALLADEELRAEWRRAPCEPRAHHAYCGGALEHTIAVGALAQAAAEAHPRLDADLLLCAALLHEVGRAHQFSYAIDFSLTRRGRLLGHGQLGARLIAERSEGLRAERRDALVHCVLFAAATAPAGERAAAGALPEAIALRELCALDAQVKAELERLPTGPDLIRTKFDHPAQGDKRDQEQRREDAPDQGDAEPDSVLVGA